MAAAPEPPSSSGFISGIARPRWHALEIAFWIAPLLAFVVLTDRRMLLSQIFV